MWLSFQRYAKYCKDVQLLTPLQSHTGVAMANTFEKMLQQFKLIKKILAVNTDNATSNDTQTTKLDQLDNTFDKENWVRCFNHTLQLSAKALLKPFNIGLSENATDNNNEVAQDNNSDLGMLKDEEQDKGSEEDKEEQIEKEDAEDDINELKDLSEDEQNRVLEDTAVVRETITKVSNLKHSRYLF
jgi:hypothetical protein